MNFLKVSDGTYIRVDKIEAVKSTFDGTIVYISGVPHESTFSISLLMNFLNSKVSETPPPAIHAGQTDLAY